MTNGIPSLMSRSLRYFRAPLRVRLRHTKRPEMKNISDMKNVSLKPAIRSNPSQRWLSTTGLKVLMGFSGLR